MISKRISIWAATLSTFLFAGNLILWRKSRWPGILPNSSAPTADVVTVENIQVFNETPETVQLELPPEVAPVSAVPLFIPANNPNAHVLPTMVLPETVPDPTQPGTGSEVAWWDVLIKVFATPGTPNEDVMISIDKDVLNRTRKHWTDFHMELGRGNRCRLGAIG